MTDQYTHADGSRECRPVGTDPNASLFTDDQAPTIAPPTPKPPFTAEQQETLDRLARNPAALLLVNAARSQAVTKHGHTDASDAELSMLAMPNKARNWIGDANEALRDERLNPHERRAIALRKYSNAVALLLAQIDKLTLESKRKESQ